MKKIVLPILLIFALFSCQSKPSENESNDEGVAAHVDESLYENGADGCTYWTSDEYVDDFGDTTSEKCIYFSCEGKFSNVITENEPLYVEIVVDRDELYFRFYLYESRQLLKNRGLLYAKAKFDDAKEITFSLNNQGLGKTSIVNSSANPKQLRDIFLNEGPIKFHVTNDKMHPTAEYNFVYDGQSWDFEQAMSEIGINIR